MKTFRLYSLLFTLIVLGSASGRAEDVPHVQNIQTMYTNGSLVTESPYKVCTTDLVTYTCYGTNAALGYLNSTYVLMLPSLNDSLVTSQIANLKQVHIFYTTVNGTKQDFLALGSVSMRIAVSEDGTHWTDVTSSATHSKGDATVLLTYPGDYYLRIKNTYSTKPIYIYKMEYTTQHCSNCFRYRP